MRLLPLLLLACIAMAADPLPVPIPTVTISPVYPYDNPDRFTKRYGPEIDGALVRWRHGVQPVAGLVDLNVLLGNPNNCGAFVRIGFTAAAPTTLHLSLGSDDGLSVIAGGQRLLDLDTGRSCNPGSNKLDAQLPAGNSEVLFRITQTYGGFALHVTATAEPTAQVHCLDLTPVPKARLPIELSAPAAVSIEILNETGGVVRRLVECKDMIAGRHTIDWDGTNDEAQPVLAGRYRWRSVENMGAYANIGAIGNSGDPRSLTQHIPTSIHDVAMDPDGNVLSANYWDESGADFTCWGRDGRVRYDARYQMRNGKPNGAPFAIVADRTHIYCAMEGWDGEPWRNAVQIQRYRLSDG